MPKKTGPPDRRPGLIRWLVGLLLWISPLAAAILIYFMTDPPLVKLCLALIVMSFGFRVMMVDAWSRQCRRRDPSDE